MAYWGGGGAGGWSGHGHGVGGQRLRSSYDGWDDEEFGSVYSHRVVRRLLPYLRPFRRRVIFALFGMIAYIATREFQPLLIGNLIDAAERGDMTAVNWNGVIFVLLALGAWAAYTTQLINTGWIGH
ncbi:MAG: hypothetical protein IIC26_06010, partial [Chloroflexi bacterium]|nr:hypothetical protein [Chloroflexota bacterium]